VLFLLIVVTFVSSFCIFVVPSFCIVIVHISSANVAFVLFFCVVDVHVMKIYGMKP
jgi:hypothetical protein